jgi:hypothetical protein
LYQRCVPRTQIACQFVLDKWTYVKWLKCPIQPKRMYCCDGKAIAIAPHECNLYEINFGKVHEVKEIMLISISM